MISGQFALTPIFIIIPNNAHIGFISMNKREMEVMIRS